MRRKYGDCQREDGNCSLCSLVNYGRDCHNKAITKLEWVRRAAGLTQQELAAAAGVHPSAIQKVELGQSEAGNLTAKSLLAIAEVLDVSPKSLI